MQTAPHSTVSTDNDASAPLLELYHEQIARAIAEGKNRKDIYNEVYPAGRASDKYKACAITQIMLKNKGIRERASYLQGEKLKPTVLNLKDWHAKLDEISLDRNYPIQSRLKAIELIGKSKNFLGGDTVNQLNIAVDARQLIKEIEDRKTAQQLSE